MLEIDIDLLIQAIAVAILLIGFLYRRKVKRHGLLMGSAILLESGAFMAIMGPVFFSSIYFFLTRFSLTLEVFLLHAFTGMVALVLSFCLFAAWLPKVSKTGPCYQTSRKRIMILTIVLWVTSVVIGALGYLLAYVF